MTSPVAFARRVVHGEPYALRRFHAVATVVWLVASVPAALLLSNSLTFVVWLSLYAVVTGHWAAYQGAAAEIESQD